MLRFPLLSALLLGLSLIPWRLAYASSDQARPTGRKVVVVVDGRLRSAFLLRATGVDRAEPAATAREKQRRLRQHFDAVIELLVRNSNRSLEVALDRLEQRRGETWTAEERTTWRRRLAEERLANLQRLQWYQRRGRFPINDHVAGRAVPVFVDNYDTACAVGHLMRESGWTDVVAAIQRSNNLIYVSDVGDGAVIDWVLESGLTQEEAALIQPAYEPPLFDATIAQLMTGDSITNRGLRYENFSLMAGMPLIPGAPIIVADLSNPSRIGVAAFNGMYTSPGGFGWIDPQYNDWLFLGSFDAGGLGPPFAGQDWMIVYNFEVVAEEAGHMITSASLYTNPKFTFNYLIGPGAVIAVDTKVYARGAGAPALAELHLDTSQGFGPFLSGEDQDSFAPQRAVRVQTVVQMTGPAQFTGMIHSFEMIPEPSALALSALGSVVFVRRRRV